MTVTQVRCGRLASVSVPIASSSAAITYTYDVVGRVTERDVDHSSTDANNVSTTFDSLGRVTGVTNALGAFTYAYVDTTSRLSSVTYPTGTGGTGHSMITDYSYYGNTGDQRLEEIQNMHSSTQLSQFDYTYNPVGTIATWTQQADSSTAVVNTLSYDNADQLINAVQSGGGSASNAYNYDPAGNRLAETTGSGTTAGQFNDLNQLTRLSSSSTSQTVAGHTSAAITSATINAIPATISSSTNFTANVPLPAGTNVVSVVATPTSSSALVTTQRYQVVTTGTTPTTLSYDANGNVTTDESGNTYAWDALNRLTAIVYSGGTHTEFAYDGLSRRTQIVERAGTTIGSGTVASTKNYLWIGPEIAEERDASNSVTKRFFPQGEQQSGTNYYYTRDHLGSVREMCSSTGAIVARYSYDPYGRTTLVSGTNLATFQYADYYAHQPSGLNLTYCRAYDSNTARWLSRDPLGELGGINIYGYVGQNPLQYTDILGLYGMQYNVTATVFSTQNDPGNNGQLPAYTNQPINDSSTQGVALPSSGLGKQYVEITNPSNGNTVIVPVIDIGPGSTNDPYWVKNSSSASNKQSGAGIDLTPATANALGIPVKIVPTKQGPEWQTLGKKPPKVNWEFVPKPNPKPNQC
jgi:RHS repeat-associated protein